MSKKATKAADNVFYKARIEAAKFNDALNSRESASEKIGIDRTRLARIELGSLNPYPEEVLLISDTYSTPELLNHYCCKLCPIGKHTVVPINQDNIENIYKLSISIFNLLGAGNEMSTTLLDVVEDGKITEDEKPKVDYIVDNLKKLSGFTNELVIALEKLEMKDED